MRMIWVIATVVLCAALAGYLYLMYVERRLAQAFIGTGKLAVQCIKTIDKLLYTPEDHAQRARLDKLGPDSPLRDWLALRRDHGRRFLDLRIREVLARRPLLDREIASLLTSPDWTDRLLALDALDLAREIPPETAATAVSMVMDFAASLPDSAVDLEKDLLAAARACSVLRDRGLPHEPASRELLAALDRFEERETWQAHLLLQEPATSAPEPY